MVYTHTSPMMRDIGSHTPMVTRNKFWKNVSFPCITRKPYPPPPPLHPTHTHTFDKKISQNVCTMHKTIASNKIKIGSDIANWFVFCSRINLFEYMQSIKQTNITDVGYETIAESCYSIDSLLAYIYQTF